MIAETSGSRPTIHPSCAHKGRRLVFPRLKPSTETISLSLPKSLLDQRKTLANKRDVP
ncbi:MAG: hypothetical protein HP496_03180 [Nitrospira sp.]|nr:hypothetical protein [Nitrospira sp.]